MGKQAPWAMGYCLPTPNLRLQTVKGGRLCLSHRQNAHRSNLRQGLFCSQSKDVVYRGLSWLRVSVRQEAWRDGAQLDFPVSDFPVSFIPRHPSLPPSWCLPTTYWGNSSLSKNFSGNPSSSHTPKGAFLCDCQPR